MQKRIIYLFIAISICIGSVGAETTEVLNLAAYGSTEYNGRYAVNTINESGLNSDGSHSISAANMWSAVDGSADFHWYKVKLEKAERLVLMHIWNGNWANYTNRGVNAFEIMYANTESDLSTDDFTDAEWHSLREDNLHEASGSADYKGEDKSLALLPDSVNWIGLKITSSHGGANGYAMLSELKLYSGTLDSIPTDTTTVGDDTVVVVTEDLYLPSIFSDKMLIQQEDSIAFWGIALEQQQVLVSTSWNEKDSVVSNEDGEWKLYIKTPSASFTPHTVSVTTLTDTIDYSNVLVGELWLCAGQSNMAFGMDNDVNYSKELIEQEGLNLRLFNTPYVAKDNPQFDIVGAEWFEASSENLSEFSAVAYYFGKHMLDSLKNTPIGLIQSAYGSATAESFMSKETLLSKPYLEDHYNNYKHSTPSKNPSWCYNAMIHPLLSYPIKGTIWYQGEANCVRASEYYETMKTLVNNWRNDFNNEDMPFYIVQLPPYNYSTAQQESGEYYSAATLRQAQLELSEDITNSGLVVTMDVGDVDNIHPKNKMPVGDRLASLALNKCYAFTNANYAGPVYKSFTVEGDIIRLTFDEVEQGILDQYAELSWFCVAGSDKKFYHGNAFIDGNDIIVSSPFVTAPEAVRFAWHNAAVPNFFNAEGFPASPFKTDDWTTFTYASGITSWSSMPDIKNHPFELTIPEITNESPAAGKRVKQTLAAYQGTDVYHVLQLPSNWEAGKKYPVIVEYAGNGPYLNKYGDVCTGKPDDAHLGYGISGGEDFIWIAMPFISADGQENQLSWWGDIEASVNYTINTVKDVCESYGGDTNLVFVTGFSRGAIACNYIGLHNDEIASLWCASIACSHYDGVITTWGYPNADQASAKVRLERLAGRPQLITQEGGGTGNTRTYLESTGVAGDFSYLDVPLRNHDDRWLLQNTPERATLRQWVNEVVECEANILAPNVVEKGQSIEVAIALKGKAPWSLSYSVNDDVFQIDTVNTTPYTFEHSVTETVTFKVVSVSDAKGHGTAGSEVTTYIYEQEITPIFDGMVRQTQDDGIFDATSTEVKKAGSWQRKSFFSFDISELSASTVLAAAFKVYLNASSASTFAVPLGLWGIAEMDFNNEVISFSQAEVLPMVSLPTSAIITESDLNSYITFDVSNYLTQSLEDEQTQMTLCLQGTNSDGAVFYFNTVESEDKQPKLCYVDNTSTTSLEDIENEDLFSIYPNPARGYFIIENTNSEKLRYQVFSLQGCKVREDFIMPNGLSTVSDLSEGIYFVSSANVTQKVLIL